MQHADIIVGLFGPVVAIIGFFWAIKTNQAVVLVRLDRLEKILLNGGGVVCRQERTENRLAALEALCAERHRTARAAAGHED